MVVRGFGGPKNRLSIVPSPSASMSTMQSSFAGVTFQVGRTATGSESEVVFKPVLHWTSAARLSVPRLIGGVALAAGQPDGTPLVLGAAPGSSPLPCTPS